MLPCSAGTPRKVSASLDVQVGTKSKPLLCPFFFLVLQYQEPDLIVHRSAFFHKKSFPSSSEPYVGQAVSFIFEEGPKGAAAVNVKEEEGGVAEPVEEEGEREMGKVRVCQR